MEPKNNYVIQPVWRVSHLPVYLGFVLSLPWNHNTTPENFRAREDAKHSP